MLFHSVKLFVSKGRYSRDAASSRLEMFWFPCVFSYFEVLRHTISQLSNALLCTCFNCACQCGLEVSGKVAGSAACKPLVNMWTCKLHAPRPSQLFKCKKIQPSVLDPAWSCRHPVFMTHGMYEKLKFPKNQTAAKYIMMCYSSSCI